MKEAKILVAALSILLLSSCAAYFNQPMEQSPSRIGEYSSSTKTLLELPEAADPVEVAVYNFSDQTGQYKPLEAGSTFSTAVTQGATTILIKALEDSGWFVPIERENLSNLSTERNIIRNTKQEYIKNLNPNEPPLPPLLYAGLLLEGGIISYDTNIVTGGIGARYFGLGGSAKYRQDRITVYLRAVSTSNGEILKTVYVSKTILSQALDANFFRFVKFQRLLEAETGITQNEPLQIAVKDAIEKAVRDLILEGIKDRLWSSKEGQEVNKVLVEEYEKEKAESADTGLFDRFMVQRDFNNYISLSTGINLIDGDYPNNTAGFMFRAEYNRRFARGLSVGLTGTIFDLVNRDIYSNVYGSVDANLQLDLLPNDDLSPFIYGGPGVVVDLVDPENDSPELGEADFKVQYGGGIQYFVSERLNLKVFAEHAIPFTDNLDRVQAGTRDDFYFNFGVGLNYYFGSNVNKGKTFRQ